MRFQLSENKLLDLQLLSHPIIGRFAEQDRRKKNLQKSVLLLKKSMKPQFWLEIIEDLEYLEDKKLLLLKSECEELVKVMTTYKHKFSQNL